MPPGLETSGTGNLRDWKPLGLQTWLKLLQEKDSVGAEALLSGSQTTLKDFVTMLRVRCERNRALDDIAVGCFLYGKVPLRLFEINQGLLSRLRLSEPTGRCCWHGEDGHTKKTCDFLHLTAVWEYKQRVFYPFDDLVENEGFRQAKKQGFPRGLLCTGHEEPVTKITCCFLHLKLEPSSQVEAASGKQPDGGQTELQQPDEGTLQVFEYNQRVSYPLNDLVENQGLRQAMNQRFPRGLLCTGHPQHVTTFTCCFLHLKSEVQNLTTLREALGQAASSLASLSDTELLCFVADLIKSREVRQSPPRWFGPLCFVTADVLDRYGEALESGKHPDDAIRLSWSAAHFQYEMNQSVEALLKLDATVKDLPRIQLPRDPSYAEEVPGLPIIVRTVGFPDEHFTLTTAHICDLSCQEVASIGDRYALKRLKTPTSLVFPVSHFANGVHSVSDIKSVVSFRAASGFYRGELLPQTISFLRHSNEFINLAILKRAESIIEPREGDCGSLYFIEIDGGFVPFGFHVASDGKFDFVNVIEFELVDAHFATAADSKHEILLHDSAGQEHEMCAVMMGTAAQLHVQGQGHKHDVLKFVTPSTDIKNFESLVEADGDVSGTKQGVNYSMSTIVAGQQYSWTSVHTGKHFFAADIFSTNGTGDNCFDFSECDKAKKKTTLHSLFRRIAVCYHLIRRSPTFDQNENHVYLQLPNGTQVTVQPPTQQQDGSLWITMMPSGPLRQGVKVRSLDAKMLDCVRFVATKDGNSNEVQRSYRLEGPLSVNQESDLMNVSAAMVFYAISLAKVEVSASPAQGRSGKHVLHFVAPSADETFELLVEADGGVFGKLTENNQYSMFTIVAGQPYSWTGESATGDKNFDFSGVEADQTITLHSLFRRIAVCYHLIRRSPTFDQTNKDVYLQLPNGTQVTVQPPKSQTANVDNSWPLWVRDVAQRQSFCITMTPSGTLPPGVKVHSLDAKMLGCVRFVTGQAEAYVSLKSNFTSDSGRVENFQEELRSCLVEGLPEEMKNQKKKKG